MKRVSEHMLTAMINAYYEKDGNSAGGILHIVLDDLNIETHHVQWCKEQAEEAADWDAVLLAEQILLIPEEQRENLIRADYW